MLATARCCDTPQGRDITREDNETFVELKGVLLGSSSFPPPVQNSGRESPTVLEVDSLHRVSPAGVTCVILALVNADLGASGLAQPWVSRW